MEKRFDCVLFANGTVSVEFFLILSIAILGQLKFEWYRADAPDTTTNFVLLQPASTSIETSPP